jgi:hypothetical protein
VHDAAWWRAAATRWAAGPFSRLSRWTQSVSVIFL